MARCKDKRKVRTRIPSHFRNVWKCMDKKILKPLKKADFALPAQPVRRRQETQRRRRPAQRRRARPLPPEEDVPEAPPVIEEPPVIDEPVIEPLGEDEAVGVAPTVAEIKAKKERRRARQFRREEFPMKELRVKLKKLPPLKKKKKKTPKKELQIKLKRLPHFPGGRAKLPKNFDYSRIKNKYRKEPETVEVGERLRIKLPGISKKLKAVKGSRNAPINVESSPEYVLQDPTPAPTVIQHMPSKYHRPVRKFAAQTPMQASQYFKN